MNNLSVVAIIVHHSGIEYTKQCLASLQTLSHRPKYTVVANNSLTKKRDSNELKAIFPYAHQLLLPNRGYSAACNAGIKFSLSLKPKFVWILNNDLCFDCPDVLSIALETIAQRSDVAAVSVKMCFIDEPHVINYAGGQIDSVNLWKKKTIGEFEVDHQQYNIIKETEWVIGANLLIPVDTFQSIGEFDEKYFLYMEDVDWSLRAKQLGYKCLYIGTTKVLHKKHASTEGVIDYYFPRSIILFTAKHYPDQLGRIVRKFYNHQFYPHLINKQYQNVICDIKIILSAFWSMPYKVAWQGIKDFFKLAVLS